LDGALETARRADLAEAALPMTGQICSTLLLTLWILANGAVVKLQPQRRPSPLTPLHFG